MTRPGYQDSTLFHTQPTEPVRPEWLYGENGQLDQQAEPEQDEASEEDN